MQKLCHQFYKFPKQQMPCVRQCELADNMCLQRTHLVSHRHAATVPPDLLQVPSRLPTSVSMLRILARAASARARLASFLASVWAAVSGRLSAGSTAPATDGGAVLWPDLGISSPDRMGAQIRKSWSELACREDAGEVTMHQVQVSWGATCLDASC